MLDTSIIQQVTEIFRNLEGNYTFRINYAPQREESNQLLAFLNDFASTSTHLNIEKHEADGETLFFTLFKNGEDTGITFRGIPNGHEFTSLLLAVLNADGKGKNLPDEGIASRIRALISSRSSISLISSPKCTPDPTTRCARRAGRLSSPER